MKNVIMVYPQDPAESRGGVETYINNVSKRLRVGTTWPGDPQFEDKIRAADIIHANGYNNPLTLKLLLKKNPRQKFILTLHSSETRGLLKKYIVRPIFDTLMGMFSFRIDAAIFVSDFEKNQFVHFLYPKRAVVIPNGVMIFKNADPRKLIIYVGRLVKHKNVDKLIKAFSVLFEKDQDWRLAIVGDGPERGKLEDLTFQALDLYWDVVMDHYTFSPVIFPGQVSQKDLNILMNKARVAVSLSEYESYGIFIGDCLGSGIPCVVNNRAALGEFVRRGYCRGITKLTPGNIVKAILGARKPPSETGLITWDKVAEKTRGVYEAV